MIEATWLTIHLDPPVGFYDRAGALPYTPLIVYERLESVGERRAQLGGENANMSANLANGDGKITALLADPPLRARATIEALIDGRREILIDGTITSIRLAEEAGITIEG